MSMTTHSFSRVGRPLVYFIVSALMSVFKVCALDLDDPSEDSTVKSIGLLKIYATYSTTNSKSRR